MEFIVAYLAFIIFQSNFAKSTSDYACDSSIYCQGELLNAVQTFKIFEDSKTFVDMPLKHNADVVEENFEVLKGQGQLNKEKIEQFVKDNFLAAGQELEVWSPGDWQQNLELLNRIKDPDLKEFAKGMNDLWKILGRKIKSDVAENPNRFSLIDVPHPFIIPGDRFREFYYWDTYWVIKGLLLSDMHTTAKNIIKNFISMVDRFGHVPNGGRIYYTRRSQPPMLIPMVDYYFKITNDTQFIRENLALLEKEHQFWMANRTKGVTYQGQTYQLSQYDMTNSHPRPEGYREDLHVAQQFPEDQRPRVYKDLASAAESGWDFSSRWFAKHGPKKFNLTSIKTTKIVPVDLNTYLCINELLLAKFARILGDREKEEMYNTQAQDRWNSINEVFWDEQDGVWYDLDISDSQPKHSRRFYASNIFPLIIPSKGHQLSLESSKVDKVLNYLEFEGVLAFSGGVPTSKINSGQQWDFPNAWPPLISLVVESLESCNNKQADKMAAKLAANWVENNYITWSKYGHMYEKYNVLKEGQAGGGGEYGVQVGFGWTNGVVLEMLDLYGEDISLSEEYRQLSSSTNQQSYSFTTFIFLYLIATLFCE